MTSDPTILGLLSACEQLGEGYARSLRAVQQLTSAGLEWPPHRSTRALFKGVKTHGDSGSPRGDSARNMTTHLLLDGADPDAIDETLEWFREESQKAIAMNMDAMRERLAVELPQ